MKDKYLIQYIYDKLESGKLDIETRTLYVNYLKGCIGLLQKFNKGGRYDEAILETYKTIQQYG